MYGGELSSGGMFKGNCLGGNLREGNVHIPVQDYKSLHVVAMICISMVNTDTDKQLLIIYTELHCTRP